MNVGNVSKPHQDNTRCSAKQVIGWKLHSSGLLRSK